MPVALLLTIGLTIVILAVAAGVTARVRRARPAVLGVGLALIPVGLYLTGVTQLTANGVKSLIDWFARTPFTTATAWGIGLAIAGIVVFVAGNLMPKHEPAPRPAAQPKAAPGKPAQPQVTGAAPTKATPAAKPAPAAKGVDPEDAEIEALLRKRGIM